LKTAIRCALFAAALFLVTACGYHNPYVYDGPDKTIYMSEWKNRSNQLEINTRLYQSLVRWFQKSGSLHVSAEKLGADLILAGEIKSIYFPSRSYISSNIAIEGRMHLTVRYILKDLQSDVVLLEEPNYVFSENYLISSANPSVTRDNEDSALSQAIEDLAQRIYQRCLAEIPKLEAKRQAQAQGRKQPEVQDKQRPAAHDQ
jgi:outer membrane lipopolysaccharide assembly protein LptE/RlpB